MKLQSVWAVGVVGFCQTFGPLSHAGTFSSDFNSGKPAGVSLYGSAIVETTGGVGNSGVLKLTANKNNQQGALVVGDLDGGKVIGGFSASFKLRMGGGTGADGFSFNFAPTLPAGPFGEEGAGTGFTVSFDTSDNGNSEAPAIDVKLGGSLIASQRINPRTGEDFADVVINVDSDGSMDLSFGQTVVFTNLFAFSPMAGLFGIGARTGGMNDNHLVDDLQITTVPLAGPSIKSVMPRGLDVAPDAPVVIELQDSTQQVDAASIKVAFNGANVAPAIAKEAGLTTVRFSHSGMLPSGSRNSIRLEFRDNSALAVMRIAQYEFQVARYLTVPSSFALGLALVDTNRTGFKIRTVQARNDAILPATLARAEAQLAGTLIDPATKLPFANEATPGPSPDKTFVEGGPINYEVEKIPIGNFIDQEAALPGLPGATFHSENAAIEILTYLALPAGFHRFGVNSDDGFKVTVGAVDARDAFSTILGQFDGMRSAADTLFSFVTESAGYYAFRLVWFQSRGGASLEFFSVQNDGTRVLINDRAVTNSIRVLRDLKSTAPSVPYVESVNPRPSEINVSRRPQLSLTLKDQRSQVVADSVQLTLNGVAVTPKVAKSGGTTSIAYQPSTALPYGSTVALSLSFRDDANPPNQFKRDWQFTTAPEIPPAGQWDFEAGNLSATFGQALEFGDTAAKEVSAQTQFGTSSSFGIPDIGGKPARVMKFKRGSTSAILQPGFIMKHGIPPNGGGALVNQWTLIMDILFPEPQEGRFCSLIQIDDPTSDADMFVRWNNIGGEGTGGLGVSGQYTGDGRTFLVKGRWHRIALAADMTSDSPVISKFIDGVKFEDQYFTAPQLDGKCSLAKTLRLFADEDNQLTSFCVNSIQIIGGKLIDEEIATLGGPTPGGISGTVVPPPASDPVLTVNWVGNNLTISWPADTSGFTLQSADSLANPLWIAVAGVSNNSFSFKPDAKPRFFRLRK